MKTADIRPRTRSTSTEITVKKISSISSTLTPESVPKPVPEFLYSEEVSIVTLVDQLLSEAYTLRASDLHLEPGESALLVRMRVDGILEEKHHLPKHIHQEIISRIKVLAQLRTDEHRAAQDGRFRIELAHIVLDVRVSIAPTYWGENAVLRLLVQRGSDFTLSTLGFCPADEEKILRALERKSGMILATGPTGSGKTTTLYTLIKMLNTSEVSLITIEDPIEYAIAGVTQIQTNNRAGLTFGSGLRSLVRQDPNIIMVGEIRDTETANIATNTALTGHLLLSTLHTSDAATTLPRLLDMGVDPYIVASTVSIAIAQRLVRLLCEYCKKEEHKKSYRAVGCAQCQGSGYRGRIGIYEVLEVTKEVEEAILQKASASRIRDIAVAGGMHTMLEDGLAKAAAGKTSIAEILRTTHA